MNLRYCNLEPFEGADGKTGVVAWDDQTAPEIYTHDRICLTGSGVTPEEAQHILGVIDKALWPLPGPIDLQSVETIDLKRIHNSIVRYIGTYIWIRDTRAYDLLADWVILTYLRPSYRFMPILMLDGTTVSGKSTLMEILHSIVYRGYLTSSFSNAALVRAVYCCDATILCDESLDNITDTVRGGDIVNFLKSATSPNLRYMRAAPKSRYDFDALKIYTSVCISVKRSEAVEDIANRTIRIQMLTKPEGEEFEHYGDYDNNFGETYEPTDYSSMTPKEIRTALYALRIVRMSGKVMGKHVDLITGPEIDEMNTLFKRALTTKDKFGRWAYGKYCDLEDPPRISNRLADIAKTMIPVAMLTDCANEVMSVIIDSGKDAREAAQNSEEANVLRALVDVYLEKKEQEPLYGKIIPSGDVLMDIFKKITTREIAAKVNDTLHDNGDLGAYDEIKTSTITYTLRSMGITYQMGRGPGRQTMLDPTTEGFFEQLDSLIRRYDPDSINILDPLKK